MNHRLSLPKPFREQVTNWVLTRGLDGGLFGFPAAEFHTKLTELAQRTFTVKRHRDFVRLMTNDAVEVETDANGRVQLPEYLMKFAQLEKDVVVVGSYSWIEIWDVTAYHAYLDTIEPQAEAIAEGLTAVQTDTESSPHA